MGILKVKAWKKGKSQEAQFEAIAFSEKIELQWSDDGSELLSHKPLHEVVYLSVRRLKDGMSFHLGLPIAKVGGGIFQIKKFHKDLIHVDYMDEQISGQAEIDSIVMINDRFAGFE